MTENESLLDKARQLAEARNHKLLPFVRQAALAERVVSHVRDTLTDPVFGEQRARACANVINKNSLTPHAHTYRTCFWAVAYRLHPLERVTVSSHEH